MAVAISSLPSIRCSNQTWIYTSKLEIYSMAPAQLQTNIRHSSVWLWGRAKVPINSKSRSRAAVDRGKCTFRNLTVRLSSERCTAAGSAHPLVIVTDGSGHSNTSPWIRTHRKNTGWVFHIAPGQEVTPVECFQIPTRDTTSQIVLITWISYFKVQYGHYLVKTFHRLKCQLFRIWEKQSSFERAAPCFFF